MSEYSLDVAFNSATTPLNSAGAIYAMGFGFAESPSGTWKEDGQKVEMLPNGATFYFSIFDTAPDPSTGESLTQIEITFFDPDNPYVIWAYSPLSLPGSKANQPNPLSSAPSSSVPSDNQSSVGCNVTNAACWRLGPYVVTLPEGIPSLTLDCTVQVTVVIATKPSITKVFSVDPEVIIEGGG